jgi:hypothetical protein
MRYGRTPNCGPRFCFFPRPRRGVAHRSGNACMSTSQDLWLLRYRPYSTTETGHWGGGIHVRLPIEGRYEGAGLLEHLIEVIYTEELRAGRFRVALMLLTIGVQLITRDQISKKAVHACVYRSPQKWRWRAQVPGGRRPVLRPPWVPRSMARCELPPSAFRSSAERGNR